MKPTGGRIGRAVTAVAAGLLLLLPAFDRPAPAAYPFAVGSDYPTVPEQTNDQGPYRIKATSAERHSESEAHAGASPGPDVNARAQAVAQDSGGALAEGVSDVAGFAAGDVR